MKKSTKKSEEQLLKEWCLSFVPLGIAVILFVACFLLETKLWLYAICTAVFGLFVVLFLRANRNITQKDGYTLIQAMAFYKVCRKSGLISESSEQNLGPVILKQAEQIEYAEHLDQKQLLRMYRCGERLCKAISEQRE